MSFQDRHSETGQNVDLQNIHFMRLLQAKWKSERKLHCLYHLISRNYFRLEMYEVCRFDLYSLYTTVDLTFDLGLQSNFVYFMLFTVVTQDTNFEYNITFF